MLSLWSIWWLVPILGYVWECQQGWWILRLGTMVETMCGSPLGFQWLPGKMLLCWSSVPGHFLVIPDHLFHLPISHKFCFKRLLMGHWLPSVRKVCHFFLFPGGVLTISLFLPRFPAPWGLRIEAGMGYYKWYFIVGLHFVHLLYGKVLLTQGINIFKQITQTVLRCDTWSEARK